MSDCIGDQNLRRDRAATLLMPIFSFGWEWLEQIVRTKMLSIRLVICLSRGDRYSCGHRSTSHILHSTAPAECLERQGLDDPELAAALAMSMDDHGGGASSAAPPSTSAAAPAHDRQVRIVMA